MNTELKYKTFDELLSEVGTDFVMYNNENLIEPAQLIKVAQRVNYDLGLKIYGTKETTLDLCHGKVKLPDDFYVMNYVNICSKLIHRYPAMSGRHTENVIIGSATSSGCPRCSKSVQECSCLATYTVECQNGEQVFVQVVEKKAFETKVYDLIGRVAIATDTGKKDALTDSNITVYIKNGFLYANISEGTLHISYQGNLEDDQGNLLVLDHPMINEYYEYALKQRILENLFISGEDVTQKLQLIEQRYRAARNNALTIVNTPDFAEMYQLWKMNRKAMYHRYYNMFKTWDGY